MTRSRRLACWLACWLAVTIAASGLLSACGGGEPAPQEDSSIQAQLAQYREDEVAHRIRIRLSNTGSATETVTALGLHWPGLTSTPSKLDYPLGPGQQAALPLPYTKVNCIPGSPAPPATPVVVVLTVRDDEGTREIQIRPESDEGVLARIWAADCRSQALEAATDVKFGTDWSPTVLNGVPALRGTIEITRESSSEPINVIAMSGSVLLNIVAIPPVRTPLLTVTPDQHKGSLAVAVFTTRRCDGHALGEAKKPYEFNVQVSLGTGEPSPATLTPDTATKAKMLRTIQRGCSLPPT